VATANPSIRVSIRQVGRSRLSSGVLQHLPTRQVLSASALAPYGSWSHHARYEPSFVPRRPTFDVSQPSVHDGHPQSSTVGAHIRRRVNGRRREARQWFPSSRYIRLSGPRWVHSQQAVRASAVRTVTNGSEDRRSMTLRLKHLGGRCIPAIRIVPEGPGSVVGQQMGSNRSS
jgi:hypothetical protein